MSKPVLFVSFRPLERAENLRAIYKAYKGDKVHILSFDPHYRQQVLSGKYDLMVTDDFPYITPGKCIMTWHGIQGGKTIGFDQPGIPYYERSLADNITYIISASSYMTNTWSRCTGVPKERILPLGFPRTDEYVGKRKGDGYTTLAEKRAYLYVPTFRDRNDTPFPDIDWDYIDSQLTDDELFVVKEHPWAFYQRRDTQITDNMANKHKHIQFISASDASAPYLYDADVVITDYSSIMFDAYLLNKPVVLFEKTTGYTSTRGMYFHYPQAYCSYYARTEQELLDLVRYRASHPFLTQPEHIIRDLVSDACDGHSCERICNLIDSMKG